MLTICVGPNGSGKSLWAMHMVERALLKDNRRIVTSLSVDVGRLNEYMQQRHGDAVPDVCQRVMRINGEQMKRFWAHRRAGWDGDYGIIPECKGPFGGPGWQSAEQIGDGVLFILDEVQTVFGARDWQKTGPEFVAYQSQHRKLGDDVIAITPSSSLIDKQFRLLCGECVVLQNLYMLKVGIIKAPRKIVFRQYQNCPPAPGEEALQKGDISIDAVGLASCYRTQEGLGIVGKTADIGREPKGVPWWMMFPAAAAAGLLAWFGVTRLTHAAVNLGLRKMNVEGGQKAAAAIKDLAPAGVNLPGFGNLPSLPPPGAVVFQQTPKPVEVKLQTSTNDVWTGYGGTPGAWTVQTPEGDVFGTNLVVRGGELVLDGEHFRRGKVKR